MKVKDKTHGKPPDQDVYLNICNTLILSDYQEKGYIYIVMLRSSLGLDSQTSVSGVHYNRPNYSLDQRL